MVSIDAESAKAICVNYRSKVVTSFNQCFSAQAGLSKHLAGVHKSESQRGEGETLAFLPK